MSNVDLPPKNKDTPWPWRTWHINAIVKITTDRNELIHFQRIYTASRVVSRGWLVSIWGIPRVGETNNNNNNIYECYHLSLQPIEIRLLRNVEEANASAFLDSSRFSRIPKALQVWPSRGAIFSKHSIQSCCPRRYLCNRQSLQQLWLHRPQYCSSVSLHPAQTTPIQSTHS